jgi:hypothetical protein
MLTPEWYKLFGLFSVLICWASIGYVLVRIPKNLSQSISHHAAQRKHEYTVFALGMTVALILMAIFAIQWVVPTLRLPTYFTVTFILAVILETITTWVPLTEGIRFTIHQWCSYGTAASIPIILIFLALSPNIGSLALYTDIFAIAVIIVFWVMFFFIKKAGEKYLIFQNLYIAVFHFALLAVAFVK